MRPASMAWIRWPTSIRPAVVLCVLATGWLSLGCGKLSGIDEYEVGDAPVENPCSDLEVPVSGVCEKVGVPHPCANGFKDDERGGCEPILPEVKCDAGLVALLNVTSCRSLAACANVFPDPPIPVVGEIRWVDVAAQVEGDGRDRMRPVRTIKAALESSSGPLTILLGAGDYREHVKIDRQVHLRGLCPDRTRLVAPTSNEPALTIVAAASDTNVNNLRISGGKGGILVNGAERVNLSYLYVDHSEGTGISFEDSAGNTGGVITYTLVEGALGIGIATYGATVTIDSTVVRSTRQTGGDLGRGISVHPSAFIDPGVDALQALPSSPRSDITIQNSVIEANSDAGIFVTGSTARIAKSVVSDTGPQRDGHGRGIVAESWDLGSLAADITVTESVIRRSADVGLRVDNSCATVEKTVIRAVGTDSSRDDPFAKERSCLGNGIRVRFNRRVAEGSTCPSGVAPLVVRESLIEDTREAGVHVEGAKALFDHTLIRSVKREACAEEFGDGIAAYAYDYSPASLELQAVRIEKTERAAVVSFGAETGVRNSVLECSGDVARAEADALGQAIAVPFDAGSSLCGCGGRWRHCGASPSTLSRSLRGCVAGSSSCQRLCYTHWFDGVQGSFRGIPDMSTWDIDSDDVVTTVSDEDGCTDTNPANAAPPGLPFRGRAVKQGYLPGIAFFIAANTESPSSRYATLESGSATVLSSLIEGAQPDFRHAIFAAVWVCEQGRILTNSPTESCLGHGVVGASVELSPPAGVRAYVNEQGAPRPEVEVPNITSNSVVTFYDLPPGEYTARVLKPEGAVDIDCSPSLAGTEFLTAWPTGNRNEIKFRVEPGSIHGSYVFCTVHR